MRPFIYGARNGIHIIDLDQTARLFERAYNFVVDTVGRGGHILMVGTKRQAQEIVREEARRSRAYFVVNRWLGGTLTNFRTIKHGPRAHAPARAHEGRRHLPVSSRRRKSRASRRSASASRSTSAGSRTWARSRRAIFVIDPAKEIDRGPGGEQARHPGHRHHRHQLRPGHDRLRHPRQRRRDPLDQAHHRAHRRRGHRGLAAPQGDVGPRRRSQRWPARRRSAAPRSFAAAAGAATTAAIARADAAS